MFLDSILGLFSSDIAIDLGTANTLVFVHFYSKEGRRKCQGKKGRSKQETGQSGGLWKKCLCHGQTALLVFFSCINTTMLKSVAA